MTDTSAPGAAPAAPAPKRAIVHIECPKIDNRGWVAIGLFALTGAVFALIAWQPTLAANQLFAMLAQAIVISGLINGVVTFLYGSSKGAADVRDQLGKALEKLPEAKP